MKELEPPLQLSGVLLINKEAFMEFGEIRKELDMLNGKINAFRGSL